MTNEIILIVSLFVTFGVVIAAYCFGGAKALYVYCAVATITANIEVLICIDAFGMEMTLGNILFASTFLATDMLSELEGKKQAKYAVNCGIFATIGFLLISQSWFLYKPNATDFAMESIKGVFSSTPRIMLVSLLVYAITQRFDVWLYHKWWKWTNEKCKDTSRYLWLRNNGSTLISQLLNTVLFSVGAFAGVYSFHTLLNIIASSYVIFIVTSLADTPFLYFARKIVRKKENKGLQKKEIVLN